MNKFSIPQTSNLTFYTSNTFNKPVLTISAKGVWADPDMPVDEAAKCVLKVLDHNIKLMVKAVEDEWKEEAAFQKHRAELSEKKEEAALVDAERYRWLRKQYWDSSFMCVVTHPKEAVKLGHHCPSGNNLDELIDTVRGEKLGAWVEVDAARGGHQMT